VKICIFTICKNEERMMKWFLRHYSTFADRIVVFDEQSTDGTRKLLAENPLVDLREWRGTGLNDEQFQQAINNFYKEARGVFDWAAWPDVDELIYHPDIRGVLGAAQEDMIASTGYALISKQWVEYDGRQAYEQVTTGTPQPNYDKLIVWRPGVDVQHAIGRHTYLPEWPKCSGRIGMTPKLKLFHLHYIGGVEETIQRNRRNYERAVNKKYAWNSLPEHDKPDQMGTVSWIRALIDGDRLRNVVSDAPMKIQFCCGGNRLPGWDNRDMDTDITKPLPFKDGAASHVLVEHGIEHISHAEAWNFLQECHRILKPRGIVRIAIPDITRMWSEMTREYQNAVQRGGHGDGTAKSCIKAAIFEHGHKGAWNRELLATMMQAVGFQTNFENIGESTDSELRGVEQHGKTVGDGVARVETSICEGVKV
jgi:predicted SAM-dependent methyltransferase